MLALINPLRKVLRKDNRVILSMKNILFLLLATILNCSAYIQTPQNPIDESISQITWNSLIIAPTYGSKLTIDSNAHHLILAKDTAILEKLNENLSIPEKTVAIHIILTRRIEKHKESLFYTAVGDILKYTYNTSHGHIISKMRNMA